MAEDRILPPNSVLGFQAADGNPLLFTLDPTTNQIAVLPINPWLFTAIINSVATGIVVPLVGSAPSLARKLQLASDLPQIVGSAG